MEHVFTKEEILHMINTNDKWLYRAIVAIDNLQQPDEKAARMSLHKDGKGWTKFDALEGSLAAEVLSMQPFLPKYALEDMRHKMNKYIGQLVKLANA